MSFPAPGFLPPARYTWIPSPHVQGLFIVIDCENALTHSGHYPEHDAKHIAKWLNERSAGYPAKAAA